MVKRNRGRLIFVGGSDVNSDWLKFVRGGRDQERDLETHDAIARRAYQERRAKEIEEEEA